MLIIKSTSSPAKEPDPSSKNYDETQIIFLQDEPPATKQNEPEEEYKIATRVQGGQVTIQQDHTNQNEAQQDIPAPALSDNYKKGMENKTTIQDQDPDGHVDILTDADIDLEEQRAKQIKPTTKQSVQHKMEEEIQTEKNKLVLENTIKKMELSQEKKIAPAEILKAIIQEKMQKTQDSQAEKKVPQRDDNYHVMSEDTHELAQLQPQKIISKKHRPAELGSENISKVQLSKETQENIPAKKKISLQDIQQGFSQFIRNGNEEYYSGQGNALHDDEQGLKRASYYRQLGQIYKNAHAIAPNLVHGNQFDQPTDNSLILITIERSGKISNCKFITSCGVERLDRHHMRIIESIGSFPPIPKYIEAPLQITATLYFRSDRSFSSSFTPSRGRSL
jgi:hypothetical protein